MRAFRDTFWNSSFIYFFESSFSLGKGLSILSFKKLAVNFIDHSCCLFSLCFINFHSDLHYFLFSSFGLLLFF